MFAALVAAGAAIEQGLDLLQPGEAGQDLGDLGQSDEVGLVVGGRGAVASCVHLRHVDEELQTGFVLKFVEGRLQPNSSLAKCTSDRQPLVRFVFIHLSEEPVDLRLELGEARGLSCGLE